MTILSGKRYFNDSLWSQAYNHNTMLLAVIRYKKTRSTTIEKVKGTGVIFLNCPCPM